MKKEKELIDCPYCYGEGGKEIGVSCQPENAIWFDDGAMTLGWEDCKHCKGTGKIVKKDKKNG